MLLGPADEGRVRRTVHHVVNGDIGVDQGRCQRWQLPLQTGGGGIDDEIERPRQLLIGPGTERPQILEFGSQLLRFSMSAVGDDQLARLLRQQRRQRTASRPTGPQQQDPAACQRHPMGLEIGYQPGAICVVPQQHAVIGQLDGIDRPRPLGPWTQSIDQGECLLLERHCDIAPLAPLGKEAAQGSGKLVDGGLGQPILQLLLGLSGEQGMNEGGLAVAHRVAKNQITIHQRVPSEGDHPI
ncbi:hypothetical protein D3C75_823250 [compost metagenome]